MDIAHLEYELNIFRKTLGSVTHYMALGLLELLERTENQNQNQTSSYFKSYRESHLAFPLRAANLVG